MTKPTAALVFGFIAATVIVSVAAFRSDSLESELKALEARCHQEDEASRAKLPDIDFHLLCDQSELDDESAVGVQGEIVRAKHRLMWWRNGPQPFAAFVSVLFAAPWLWYFVLRRIRELREAIIGR